MDTKGPFFPSSKGNSYFFVIFNAFSHFVVTNLTPQISSKYALQTLLHHWITKFGPSENLVTGRGTEHGNQQMTHLCSLFVIDRSPPTPYSPLTNGLVEVQNCNLGTHLRLFLQNPQINGHFKLKCVLMLIILLLYLNKNSPPIQLFFIPILVST